MCIVVVEQGKQQKFGVGSGGGGGRGKQYKCGCGGCGGGFRGERKMKKRG